MTVCLNSTAEPQAQVVQIGGGSYRSELPAGHARPCDRNGRPVRPRLADGFEGHAPTSEFYSSLVWRRSSDAPFGQPMYPNPLALKAHADGLGLAYVRDPVVTRDAYAYRLTERNEALRVSLEGLKADAAEIERAGDWTATAGWHAGGRSLRASFGHGLPFAFFQFEGAVPVVRCNAALGTPEVFAEIGGALGLRVGEGAYGLFAPEGAEWIRREGELRLSGSTDGVFSVAALPDDSPETFALFKRHALTFVVGSRVGWEYRGARGTVRATFEFETEAHGADVPPLVALFRHQWVNAPHIAFAAPTFDSARGSMKLAVRSRFALDLPFAGVLPALPPPTEPDRDVVVRELDRVLAAGDLVRRADVYWSGKSLGKLSQLIQVADGVGHTEARDRMIEALRKDLEDWFTHSGDRDGRFLAYDEAWSALIAYPDSFGSAKELNDHHFHYGYLVLAAATVAQFDPDWAERFGGVVELLIRDVASPYRDDALFPFLRHMDPYAGFSLASGHQDFIDGNNQESSSESMNFAAGVVLWGAHTQNRELAELGAFLHALESAAIEQYWFDVDDAVFPEGMKRPSVGIVWENGAHYGTWFSAEPGAIHGIQLLPIHGGSLYLGRHPQYVERNLSALRAAKPGAERYWPDIFWAFEALADGRKARSAIARTASYTPEVGFSRAALRHWVRSLAEMGALDPAVTGEIPTSAVFRSGTVRTYVAYNPGREVRTVRFSDGHELEVAARTLGHERLSNETD